MKSIYTNTSFSFLDKNNARKNVLFVIFEIFSCIKALSICDASSLFSCLNEAVSVWIRSFIPCCFALSLSACTCFILSLSQSIALSYPAQIASVLSLILADISSCIALEVLSVSFVISLMLADMYSSLS